MTQPEALSVAIIGSFRQHYAEVLVAWSVFDAAGWTITSPRRSAIIDEGVEFVRFESDPPDWDDGMVQMIAMHRIMRSDFTYVVAPDGYIGRTTCYELGRLLQADRPVYFSERPHDLPVAIPATRVLDPASLVATMGQSGPTSVYGADSDDYANLERRLLRGDYEQV